MSYTYEYPRPAVTVDGILFGVNFEQEQLEVLLVRRGIDPYKDQLALPGGFVNMDESLETAVLRELQEETAADIEVAHLEQLYTFGTPNRDPRGRVISVAYFGLVDSDNFQDVKGGDDASEAMWVSTKIAMNMELAFDHNEILKTALNRLQAKVRYAPLGFSLLPKTFPLSTLRKLYEIILGQDIEKRNFRKKILSMNILRPVGKQQNVQHTKGTLYEFDKAAYDNKVQEGWNFEIRLKDKKEKEKC